MKIETKFEIGQQIFLVHVRDEMETSPCPLCGGAGKIKGTDDMENDHAFNCPAGSYYESCRPDGAEQCHNGMVDIRMGSVVDVQVLTVGQIKMEIGGLDSNSNMGYHDEQTHERHESVMCYETGIGSGNVWDVEGRADFKPFADEDEARVWGAARVAERLEVIA